MKKLYVKFKKPRTVKEFLNIYFSKNTDNRENIWVSGDATYHDEECKELHCGLGKIRSFNNLLRVIKTYYSSYTEKKLLTLLFSTKLDNKILWVNYCSDIARPTIWYYTNQSSKLEYNNLPIQWRNLLKKININSTTEFNKLMNNG